MLSTHATNPNALRIAVVDDEPIIQETLRSYFVDAGFRVSCADTAESLRRILEDGPVDLILLDIRLPDGDGLSLMQSIRADSDVPVILVTSRTEEADRVVGLELGADDYVTKPFSPRELLARVHTVLRRTRHLPEPEPAGVRRFGGWTLDLNNHRLSGPDGTSTRLTHGEFDLLAALTRRPGRIMSRDNLLEAMVDREWTPNDRTIDVLISRLRRKIEPDPGKPRFIVTEYGLGYVFAERVT